jgi:hypothetical protein
MKLISVARHYSSPLRRARQTLEASWSGLLPWESKPIIKEALRETIGMHTCDQRESRDVIERESPGWVLDRDFTFRDEMWCMRPRGCPDESEGVMQLRIGWRARRRRRFECSASSIGSLRTTMPKSFRSLRMEVRPSRVAWCSF